MIAYDVARQIEDQGRLHLSPAPLVEHRCRCGATSLAQTSQTMFCHGPMKVGPMKVGTVQALIKL